jgi:DNA-binding MarR family transcriptional regulator
VHSVFVRGRSRDSCLTDYNSAYISAGMTSSARPQPGLGSLLRALLAHLDGDVERLYREAGIDFRPRYYPIARALLHEPRVTLAHLARECGLTHSAISQTVSEMARRGLVVARPGKDGRERLVSLTPRGKRACARLDALWNAVRLAAADLDAELTVPLSALAAEALGALERRSFAERVRRRLDTSEVEGGENA